MTQPKLRVLYLIDSLKMGGAERITVALMPFLNEITPIICTLYDHETPLTQQLGDVKHICIHAKKLADPAGFRRLLQVIKDEKIDIIHAQLQHGTVFASLAKLLTGVPFVVTRHVVEDDLTSTKKKRLVYVEHLALKATSRLIYVSSATQAYHRQQFSIDDARVQTVYNGIDLSRFQQSVDKATMRQQLGLPSGVPLVVMVGVMRPRKGQDVCIEAARLTPTIQYLLVGDGEEAPALQKQAEGLANVHFLGLRKDIPEILHASDVLILPSDSEALPTVLIEAGGAGLPVVATRVGGVPEIVNEGETGILIPPRDPQALAEALRQLFADTARLQKMGQSAYQLVKSRFTLEKQAENLTAIYRQVTKR